MDVVELAKHLINIQSTSGQEKSMSDFLATYLQERGWMVSLQEVEPERYNVFATRPGVENPSVLFNTHTDTVPPHIPVREDNGWLYGRGACDTKSLIAAQLLAAQSLVEEGIDDIGLLYVVGEEVDHCGMKKANDLGLSPSYLIVGEPTESTLARRQKGIVKFRLEAKGKAAHSGYPETGVSSIEPLLDVLNDLRNEPWPKSKSLGATTLNIGTLHGGRAANVVPDEAYAEILIRVVTDEQSIKQRVLEIVNDRVLCIMISGNDPVELTALEGYETSVVAFNTDIPYFSFGGKSLLWGPGSILDAHTANERIKIEDLRAAVRMYAQIAKDCLAL